MKTFSQWVTEGSVQTLARSIPRDKLLVYKNHLAATMPSGKVKHSLRVGGTLAKIGAEPHIVKAAIFHDFSERGGKVEEIRHHVGPHAIELVNHLSSTKAAPTQSVNEPLEHVKHILADPKMTPAMKNAFVQVKMSDRLDNLKRRHEAGGIGDNYNRKSTKLVKHLLHHYSGEREPIDALRKKLKDYGVQTKRKHIGRLVPPIYQRI